MNATENDITAEAPAVRVSAHADCTHPKTKAARAKCRRERAAAWVEVVRGDVDKGATVRVTHDGDVSEGQLLGWGEKRLVLRVTDADGETSRETLATAMIDRVEAQA